MTAQSELQAQLNAKVEEAASAVLTRQRGESEAAAAVGTGQEPEAPAAPAAPPVAPEGGESENTPPVEEATPPAEAQEGTAEEDVPTTYYGVEVPGTAEERQAVIEALSGRDQHIQKLLRTAAEAAKAPAEEAPAAPAPAPVVEAPEVTDEDILSELGIRAEDEDMSDPRIQAIIGLARFSLDLKDEVTTVKQGVAVRETETLWNTQLDALEKQYGPLPESITRDDVLEHAAKSGIAEPVDAYWRIMGPARAEVLTAVQARRDAAEKNLKRGSSSPVRSRTEGELGEAPLESKNTKDAVKEVMLRLEKAGKFDFGRE